jgi:hypothetical protein
MDYVDQLPDDDSGCGREIVFELIRGIRMFHGMFHEEHFEYVIH